MSQTNTDGPSLAPGAGQPLPAYGPALAPDGAAWLRALDWRQFESLVAEAFRRNGFRVTRTQDGADGGIDLVVERGAGRWFVQCKHWRHEKVGAPVVREMKGLVAHHGAAGGIIVTSGQFSDDAYAFARAAGVQLVGGPATLEFVVNGQLPDAALLGGTAPGGVPTAMPMSGPPRCPICGSAMALQRARKGAHKGEPFWGCQSYPSCRGMTPVRPEDGIPPRTPASPVSARRRRPAAVGALIAVLTTLAGVVGIFVLVGVLINGVMSLALRPSPPTWQGAGQPDRAAGSGAPARVVAVGEQPMGIAVDAKAGRAYTANFDSKDVSVIDIESMKVVDTFGVPGRPAAIAVDPKARVVWVSDFNGSSVYCIDLKTRKRVTELKADDQTDFLAIDPGRHRLYATSRTSDHIRVYDTARKRELASIEGSAPGALAVDLEHGVLHVASREFGRVWQYGTKQKKWTQLPYSMYRTRAIAVDGDRRRLYVSSDRTTEYNLATEDSTELGGSADALVIEPRRRTLYAVDSEADTVTEVKVG